MTPKEIADKNYPHQGLNAGGILPARELESDIQSAIDSAVKAERDRLFDIFEDAAYVNPVGDIHDSIHKISGALYDLAELIKEDQA